MLFFFGIIAGLSKDTYFLMNYLTTMREGISTIVNINPVKKMNYYYYLKIARATSNFPANPSFRGRVFSRLAYFP